jgi:hypothetical protein
MMKYKQVLSFFVFAISVCEDSPPVDMISDSIRCKLGDFIYRLNRVYERIIGNMYVAIHNQPSI